MDSYICLSMREVTCYFSYVEYICDTIIDQAILEYLYWEEYYTTPSGEKITIAFDDDDNIICSSL